MDRFQAFETLYESEGNAQRAALYLSYALVIQLAGWDALPLSNGKRNGVRASFARAGIDLNGIEFHPGGSDTTMKLGQMMTKKQIEEQRLEQVREFGMLVANKYGRFDTKLPRIEKYIPNEEAE